MGFVDDRQRNFRQSTRRAHQALEGRTEQPFGRDKQHFHPFVPQITQHVPGLLRGHVGRQTSPGKGRRQGIQLVLDQGQQRRDDQSHPRQQKGRNLINQGFSRPRGRHHQRGLSTKQTFDGPFLRGAKIIKTKHLFQHSFGLLHVCQSRRATLVVFNGRHFLFVKKQLIVVVVVAVAVAVVVTTSTSTTVRLQTKCLVHLISLGTKRIF